MRVVIQRVRSASVTVDGEVVGRIGRGALVLVGLAREDTPKQVDAMIKKILNVRLWPDPADENRTWASGIVQNNYEVLLVSQFTLFGQLKGYKPDFHHAMPPTEAKQMYENMVEQTRKMYVRERVQSGIFAADMLVELQNDGPVTIILESPQDPTANKPQKNGSKDEVKQDNKSDSTPQTSGNEDTKEQQQDVSANELRMSKQERRQLRRIEAQKTATGTESKSLSPSPCSSPRADLTSSSTQLNPDLGSQHMTIHIQENVDDVILVGDNTQQPQLSTAISECSALAGAPTMFAGTEAPSVTTAHPAMTEITRAYPGTRTKANTTQGKTTDDVHVGASFKPFIHGVKETALNPSQVEAGMGKSDNEDQHCAASMILAESGATGFDIPGSASALGTGYAVGSPSMSSGQPEIPLAAPSVFLATTSLGIPEANEAHTRHATSVYEAPSKNQMVSSSASEAAVPKSNLVRAEGTSRLDLQRFTQQEQELEKYRSLVRRQAFELALTKVELQEVRRITNVEPISREKLHTYLRSTNGISTPLDAPNIAGFATSVAATVPGLGTTNSLVGADFVVAEGDAEADDDGADTDAQIFATPLGGPGRRATDARTVHGGQGISGSRGLAVNPNAGRCSSSVVMGPRTPGAGMGLGMNSGGPAALTNALGGSATDHTEGAPVFSTHLGEADRDASQAPLLMFDAIEVRSSAPRGFTHGHGLAAHQMPIQLHVPLTMPMQLTSTVAQASGGYITGTRPRASSEAGSIGSSSGSVSGMPTTVTTNVRPMAQPIRSSASGMRTVQRQTVHQTAHGNDRSHILQAPGSARLRPHTKASTLTKPLRRSSGIPMAQSGDDGELDAISAGGDVDLPEALVDEILDDGNEPSYDALGDVAEASHHALHPLQSTSFHEDLTENLSASNLAPGHSEEDVHNPLSHDPDLRRRDDEGRSEHGPIRHISDRSGSRQVALGTTQSLSGFIFPRQSSEPRYCQSHQQESQPPPLQQQQQQRQPLTPSQPIDSVDEVLDVVDYDNEVLESAADVDLYPSNRERLNGVTEPMVAPSTVSFESSHAVAAGTDIGPAAIYPQRYVQPDYAAPSKAQSEAPVAANETRAHLDALRALISPTLGGRGLEDAGEDIHGDVVLRAQEAAELNQLLDRLKVLVASVQQNLPRDTQSVHGQYTNSPTNGARQTKFQRVSSSSSSSSIDVGEVAGHRPRSATQSMHIQGKNPTMDRTTSIASQPNPRDSAHQLRVRTTSPQTMRGLNSPPPPPAPPRTPHGAHGANAGSSMLQQQIEAQLNAASGSASSVASIGSAALGSQFSMVAAAGSIQGGNVRGNTAVGSIKRGAASFFSPAVPSRHHARGSMDGAASVDGAGTTASEVGGRATTARELSFVARSVSPEPASASHVATRDSQSTNLGVSLITPSNHSPVRVRPGSATGHSSASNQVVSPASSFSALSEKKKLPFK